MESVPVRSCQLQACGNHIWLDEHARLTTQVYFHGQEVQGASQIFISTLATNYRDYRLQTMRLLGLLCSARLFEDYLRGVFPAPPDLCDSLSVSNPEPDKSVTLYCGADIIAFREKELHVPSGNVRGNALLYSNGLAVASVLSFDAHG